MAPTLSFVIWTILAVVHLGQAQIGYNPKTNTLKCSKPGGHYCLDGSLRSPVMLSCVSNTDIEIRSCNVELSKILPGKYEETAVCYESSPSAGDALCAFNETGYTLDGTRVNLPETSLCDAPVSPLSKRDGSPRSINPTPTTTITVTVYERTQAQVGTQTTSIESETTAVPESGNTTATAMPGSSSSSYRSRSTETEASLVDTNTAACLNPWPGHELIAATISGSSSLGISSISTFISTQTGSMPDQETITPTLQPHFLMATSIGTVSSTNYAFIQIVTASITETETSTTPTTTAPTTIPTSVTFTTPNSEPKSENSWVIISEISSMITESGQEKTGTIVVVTVRPTPATSPRERETGTSMGSLVASSSSSLTGVILVSPSQTMNADNATVSSESTKVGLSMTWLMLFWLMGMVWVLVAGV